MRDLNTAKNERRIKNAKRAGRLYVETRTPEQIKIDREAHEAKLRANGWKGDATIRGQTQR
jgi:hypothetical protein